MHLSLSSLGSLALLLCLGAAGGALALQVERWIDRILQRRDDRLYRADYERIIRLCDPDELSTDPRELLDAWLTEQLRLIHALGQCRLCEEGVSPEPEVDLFLARRKGLILKYRLADPDTANAITWFVAHVAVIETAAPTEIDFDEFERELIFRAGEVRHAASMQRHAGPPTH